MLPLGTSAPPFQLVDTRGIPVALQDFKNAKALVVIFMCNHCPYVKHVAPELVRIVNDYQSKGVAFVGISSNDAGRTRTIPTRKWRWKRSCKDIRFPYLYDPTQEVAKAYRAACTPDFFVFDGQLKLAYRGQMDDSRPKTDRPLTGKDLRAALDDILAGKPVSVTQRPSIGCNIKWLPSQEPEYFESAIVKS